MYKIFFYAEEFNLTEDLAWTFFHFFRHNHQFYLSAQYFASEQLFLFYVIVIGGREVIMTNQRPVLSLSDQSGGRGLQSKHQYYE